MYCCAHENSRETLLCGDRAQVEEHCQMQTYGWVQHASLLLFIFFHHHAVNGQDVEITSDPAVSDVYRQPDSLLCLH
ncbi:hypothetical protein VFPPC_16913 [Pochonia chlamydosporia 170]|uniref:Uncharacterized protein n=1 Tax=Pochonia chlamydosporia 170 TaxID=1380566 RepID=A0A179F0K7_METCM|nr:hypothetical protein VFPPC_16913 [Pochonia chlamydosporia 170]OAQ58997.1 hypothetical protein VFPPC_16913 [Pochonia chlamydosporia 170]